MVMDRPITLIGFMGSGKSTIGRQIAREKKREFTDLDMYIQKTTGRSIPDIFKLLGEDKFREIESDCLKEVLEFPNQVIALGGGTPCFHDNMKAIKSLSRSIYLKVSPEGLANRLMRSPSPRPLIEGKSPGELIEYIRLELKKREEFYLQADFVIESDQTRFDDLLALVFV
jgi:shikimate kinase